MGIRPAMYINGNYSSILQSASSSLRNQLAQPPSALPSVVGPGYPMLWNARYGDQDESGFDWTAIPVQTATPKTWPSTLSSYYGPWDDYGNAQPWAFWQYASVARLSGYNNGNSNIDVNVSHGDIEFVKDQLIPALWWNNSSGDWSTLSNWNSGQTPIAPQVGANQSPVQGTTTLPTARLPGAAGSGPTAGSNDTVILERPNADITVTLSSGNHNIRKLYMRETLAITGGSLTINYDPNYYSDTINYPDAMRSGPISAQFSGPVSLSGAGSLSVNTLQVDSQQTFTLGGGAGALTFQQINLMPHASSPAKIAVTGDVNLNPLNNSAAAISVGSGAGNAGSVDLTGGTRAFNVGNGAAAVDLAVNVPVVNGSLTKTGAGTLALNAASTYTGDTRVQAGALRLATASLSNSADVYLSTGALLDLAYSGQPDSINQLFFEGLPQAVGVWGAVGSGAQFTSSLLTGTGLLSVTSIGSPSPPGPAGNVIDDFEIDEGHFNWNYNFSPSSQTFGLSGGPANSAGPSDRVTTEHQGSGTASQLLNLVIDATGDNAWQLRHNSGIGTAATPAGNVPLPGTGYVGFWLKTDDLGTSVRIGIDDPLGANTTALEISSTKSVTADNQWHLYQWDFGDANSWYAFAGGANGQIDAENGNVSIDSIWFNGAGNVQIYMDNVMHNPAGLITPGYIPGDFDGDGLVNAADYSAWRTTFGQAVAPWTGADGNGDGTVNLADYILWRRYFTTPGSGTALGESSAIPEPAGVLPIAIALVVMLLGNRKAILIHS
ncbi:MAG: autotransporter-associated beta strand repeat-containing protein [Pirellulales bacterium]|nr:autotransporter-associated beta strand repeat-containing protein [Pirellulales bacterium]